MRKIIFLDFDGVLNTEKQKNKRTKLFQFLTNKIETFYLDFDSLCLKTAEVSFYFAVIIV